MNRRDYLLWRNRMILVLIGTLILVLSTYPIHQLILSWENREDPEKVVLFGVGDALYKIFGVWGITISLLIIGIGVMIASISQILYYNRRLRELAPVIE